MRPPSLTNLEKSIVLLRFSPRKMTLRNNWRKLFAGNRTTKLPEMNSRESLKILPTTSLSSKKKFTKPTRLHWNF
jgi:hypothetical protein